MQELQLIGQPIGRSTNVGSLQYTNLYPHQTQDGRIVLFGTPGLDEVKSLGDYPVRGAAVFGYFIYVVAFNTLYQIDPVVGSPIPVGVMLSQQGPVSMTNNGTQLIVVDGSNGYIFCPKDPTTGDEYFKRIDAEGFPYGQCDTVCFLDGYFIVNAKNSQAYYYSGIYDGLAWDALDFNTAEAQPDQVVAVASTFGYLYVFGKYHTEVWYNAADINSIFLRADGMTMAIGCAAVWSVTKIGQTDGSLAWLAYSPQGHGFAVINDGGANFQRISTPEVEYFWSKMGRIDDAIAYSYTLEGHNFYVITFPSANQTWAYDFTTQQWHQRCSGRGRHLGQYYAFFNGRHYLSSYKDGSFYRMDNDVYVDGDMPITRSVTTATMGGDTMLTSYTSCQIDMERGVGLPSGQGSDPKIQMSFSDDGGHVWSNTLEGGIGKQGDYNLRVIWRRLGRSFRRTWRFTITEPVKVVLINLTIFTE